MSITFTCRSPEEMQAAVRRFSQVFPEGVKRALWMYARLVMNDAQERVPVDFGYLRATGWVGEPYIDMERICIELGFYASYAAAVHDIPEPPMKSEGGRSAHHEHGQWHYLLDPLTEHDPEMIPYIIEQVEAMLGGAA